MRVEQDLVTRVGAMTRDMNGSRGRLDFSLALQHPARAVYQQKVIGPHLGPVNAERIQAQKLTDYAHQFARRAFESRPFVHQHPIFPTTPHPQAHFIRQVPALKFLSVSPKSIQFTTVMGLRVQIDQRGENRPRGGGCDIRAIERVID
jgi:hypothetical protein